MKKFRLYHEEQNHRPLRLLWLHFKRQHSAMLGLSVFLFLFALVLLAPFLRPHDPYLQNPELLLLAPSWEGTGLVHYLFGTDDLGRDILSRLMTGAIYTFGLAFFSVAIALLLGLIFGVLAGMSKGIKSSIFNHVLDLALTIPSLLLAILIVAVLGPGLWNTIWAIVIALLPQFVHGIRNEIQDTLKQDYVTAYRLDGASNWHVLRYAVLPTILETITLMSSIALSTAILDIAALGFLGLGAQAPLAEWGAMIADALDLIYIAPWAIALPGLFLFASVLSVNLVGDGLRSAIKKRRES